MFELARSFAALPNDREREAICTFVPALAGASAARQQAGDALAGAESRACG